MITEVIVLSIRLPEDIEKRLETLARQTGRSKSFYARQAIVEKLEDLEDVYLAEKVLERVRSGEEAVLTSDEMWAAASDRELDD